MPAFQDLKPIDLDSKEKRSKYTIAIVGCGHKGIFYANLFADMGFQVVCTDANASVLKKLAKGKTPFAIPEVEVKFKNHVTKEKICVISELKNAVSQSAVVVLSINIKRDEQKTNDDNGLLSTCKQIGSAMRQGTLVLYGGVAAMGFMEGIKETLENTSGLKAGQQFGLAYCPLVIPFQPDLGFKVAAADKMSLQVASAILKTLTKKVTEISDFKIAEIAILFNLAKQDSSVALANELALFCENANVDCFSVLKIINQDDPAFYPAVADEKNRTQTYLLLETAENFNAKLKIPVLARQINEDMVKYAVNLTAEAFRFSGKTLRRGKVAVLGSANPVSATSAFIKLLEQKGAKVSLYDPAARKESLDARVVKRSLNEAVEGTDCLVLLSELETLGRFNLKKIKVLMKSPSVIVDLMGKFEPAKVETEGFIYAGLGRGIEKK